MLPEDSILDWFMRFCPVLTGVTKLPVFDGVASVSIPCEVFLVCLLACFRLMAAPAATFIELSICYLLIKDGAPLREAAVTLEV